MPFYSPQREHAADDDAPVDNIFLTRDQDAVGQIVQALRDIDNGFVWQWNIDSRPDLAMSSPAEDLRQWTRSDIALCCTRFPLTDEFERDKMIEMGHDRPHLRVIRMPQHPLGRAIRFATGQVMSEVTRTSCRLADDLADAVNPASESWASVQFTMHGHARLTGYFVRGEKALTKFRPGSNLSLGYLLYAPRLIQPNEDPPLAAECRWLHVYGHAGVETVVWSHQLRFRYLGLMETVLRENVPRVIVGLFPYPRLIDSDPKRFQRIRSRIVVNAAYKHNRWYDYGPVNGLPIKSASEFRSDN